MKRVKLKAILKMILYFQVFLVVVASLVMSFKDIAVLILFLLSMFFYYVVTKSDQKWAKYVLLVNAILGWVNAGRYFDAFAYVQGSTLILIYLIFFLFNLPLTAYVYLLFRE